MLKVNREFFENTTQFYAKRQNDTYIIYINMYLVYSNCNELDVKGEIELNQQYRVEKVKTIIFVNAELANEKIKLYSENISKMF